MYVAGSCRGKRRGLAFTLCLFSKTKLPALREVVATHRKASCENWQGMIRIPAGSQSPQDAHVLCISCPCHRLAIASHSQRGSRYEHVSSALCLYPVRLPPPPPASLPARRSTRVTACYPRSNRRCRPCPDSNLPLLLRFLSGVKPSPLEAALVEDHGVLHVEPRVRDHRHHGVGPLGVVVQLELPVSACLHDRRLREEHLYHGPADDRRKDDRAIATRKFGVKRGGERVTKQLTFPRGKAEIDVDEQ